MIVSENAPLNESRLPSLDGWRAISIGLVLVQHSYAQPGWPKALDFSPLVAVGGVGVRFFFVISGFLITWLLLKEHQKTGRVSLKAFYVRRCLRILPIYLVYLICTAVIQSSGPLSLSNAEWLRAITFTVNFGGAEAPLGHLWTLGVEEQFYLLWPFLVAMFCGIRTGRLVTCLILPVIACPVLRFLAQHVEIQNPILNLVLKWHSFFTVCDGLAIGCLGAVAFTFHRKRLSSMLLKKPLLTLATGSALILLPLTFWIIPDLRALKPLQDTLQCSGFLLLLLHSIQSPGWVPYSVLNTTLFTSVGALSYSLYLWHGLFDMPPALWPFSMDTLHGFPNWLIGVFAAGWLSFHLIEQPALRRKKQLLRALGLQG